ncbi:FAD/FMN-containing dehydrogenase [Bradyrhizobium sp. cir1]|uniref:FAD-binding oxidoreductase n=1 Tax=Bradyrhizobium sp. cir1 TaxID=1445730 RepID=UPI001605B72B|nr:FAD-binding oxidoreductase [Bradyrhizobium sp. cir1]MBB4375121.1 FAD/FMN-containing dehydrogenase [Bradyrhizobium sp. cir1]
MTTISGWGRYPIGDTEIISPRTADAARRATAAGDQAIARGNGRAYGDAAIGIRQTIALCHLNRMRAFDPTTGRVTVEAGLLLSDLITTFLPRGFFPYVVPGTDLITVGGAIAADIHGKNHHSEGGFGRYVDELLLALPTGEMLLASRDEHPDLFWATIGGMGLTGIILEATISLRPVETGWIRQRTIAADNLAAAITALQSCESVTYSVAWIDCLASGGRLGRSLIFLGEHAASDQLDEEQAVNRFPLRKPSLSIPIDLPYFVLNNWTVAAFNEFYFRSGARKSTSFTLLPVHSYFFPLDAIGNWNRIYGRRGFLQHQSVLPIKNAESTLAEMLDRIAQRGGSSFLAVLKKLSQGSGPLSFPMPGYTLALDFPIARDVFSFLDELDELVVAASGRLYLAKDARQLRATFEGGYPDMSSFRELRRTIDPGRRLQSRLAQRIGI